MTYTKWKQMEEEGYSSDIISFLFFISTNEELDMAHPKTRAIVALMERKQLVSEGTITIKGQQLLDNLGNDEEAPMRRIKSIDEFEEWWKTYPATDAFAMDGFSFAGTQSKRVKKELCKKKFNELVNQGIDARDIINATAFHILQAKKLSVKRGTSQLTYIANSERYLRELMFEPYIDLAKEKQEEPQYKSNII